MTIDKIEKKIQKIDEDLTAAREKFEEYRSKISTLEKERENAENLRIVQIVRNTEITPETLKQILSMQKNETQNFVATTAIPQIIPDVTNETLSENLPEIEIKSERKFDYENLKEID